jgi:hypothetical protein
MQETERTLTLGDRKLRMTKPVIMDCNTIIVPVMNSISKFALGELDLFSHFRPIDIDNLQKLECQYCVWLDTGKNLTLFDLSENMHEFMAFTAEFLEFTFGFFSQARKIQMVKLIGQTSGQSEEKKQ